MKKFSYAAVLFLLVGLTSIAHAREREKEIIPWPPNLPVYDHIVIVVEENKDYEEVIGQNYAPYLNQTLKAEGADFVQMYGEEHFSQGNYFWLFSGDNHNVGFVDTPPEGIPFSTPNLASQLSEKTPNPLTFKGYAENLPTNHLAPFDEKKLYARKHVPWVSFDNVPVSCTVDFKEFPQNADGFKKLPTVSFVIPNLNNDMHNIPEGGTIEDAVRKGDKWLEDNIGPYYNWAKTNNSLLIVTFDENDDKRSYCGLTNPWFAEFYRNDGKIKKILDPELYEDMKNRTITIFAGAHIRPGIYKEDRGITHVNILRTIESMYGLPKAGAQQPNAAGESFVANDLVVTEEQSLKGKPLVKKGISDDYIITDVFEYVK